MADIKLSGQDDLAKLMTKDDTWVPPRRVAEYLGLVLKVIASSRYTDMYQELSPRDLQAVIKVKAHRCLHKGQLDLEEVVDIGAYTGLLFLRCPPAVETLLAADALPKQIHSIEKAHGEEPPGICLIKDDGVVKVVSVGDEEQEAQVSGPETEAAKSEPEAGKTEEKVSTDEEEKRNENCLEGMKCFACDSRGPFVIVTTCLAEVHDDGIETTAEHEWTDESFCVCKSCDRSGTVKEFLTEEAPETSDSTEPAGEDDGNVTSAPEEPAPAKEEDKKEEEETVPQPGPKPQIIPVAVFQQPKPRKSKRKKTRKKKRAR